MSFEPTDLAFNELLTRFILAQHNYLSNPLRFLASLYEEKPYLTQSLFILLLKTSTMRHELNH